MTVETTKEKFIYKYYSINEYTLRVLLNNQLYFASPLEFNDPFECQFLLNLIADSEAEKDLISKMNLTKREVELFENSGLKSNVSSDLTPKFIRELIKGIGITCFTEKNDDFLMWSHYANSHKGICLKFDWKIHEKYFQGKKVSYSDRIPLIEYSSAQGFQNQIPKIVSNKLLHWKYENEVRSVINISDGLRCPSFNPKALAGIIFGEKTAVADIELIRRIVNLHDEYKNVVFEKAELSREESRILVREY